MNKYLLSLDPFITRSRPKIQKKSQPFLTEILQLLILKEDVTGGDFTDIEKSKIDKLGEEQTE